MSNKVLPSRLILIAMSSLMLSQYACVAQREVEQPCGPVSYSQTLRMTLDSEYSIPHCSVFYSNAGSYIKAVVSKEMFQHLCREVLPGHLDDTDSLLSTVLFLSINTSDSLNQFDVRALDILGVGTYAKTASPSALKLKVSTYYHKSSSTGNRALLECTTDGFFTNDLFVVSEYLNRKASTHNRAVLSLYCENRVGQWLDANPTGFEDHKKAYEELKAIVEKLGQ